MDIKSEQSIPLKTVKPDLEISNAKQKDLQLREKSRDMEAIFISQLFKAMEKTMGSIHSGEPKNNLSSMMFSTVMGQAVAEQGGIGLAEMIYRSLAAKQESNIDIDQYKINEIDLLSKIEYLRPNDE